ncbi:MAG: T9SS type A sorting domain-containing protein [Ignavibacteriaceae bacterium]
MKRLLLLLLLPFIIYGQPEHTGELRIELINHGSLWDVTIKLTAISARWDENYELTEEYEIAYVYLTSGHENSQTIADFDHILDPNAGENPIFAVGLYKISAIENGVEQAYFYCDWRTSDWRTSLDVSFKYDVGNKRFRNWGNTQTIDDSYQTLWDLTGNILETSGLEEYWNNCLAVFNNGDNRPKFAWGPLPGFSNNYYKIYKKKGTPNFVLYDSTTATTYVDVSEEIYSGLPHANEGHVYYKITSVGYPVENPFSTPYESDYSNTVDIRVIMPPLDKRGNSSANSKNYSLLQNYPNPFNPSTIISYQTPIYNFVTLKVFDVLGREVAELINTYKEAGTHSVEFDASSLTSGIYFYKIQIGNYVETRKFILQK